MPVPTTDRSMLRSKYINEHLEVICQILNRGGEPYY